MASVYLIHAYTPPSQPPSFPLSLQLDDHWWHIPAFEPFEIDSVFYAEKLIEIYGPVYGIIPIPVLKTRTGTSFDIDAAEEAATVNLKQVEESLVLGWVREQQDTRIKNNLPALPPSGRVEEIIRIHHIDVKKKFNLDIAGAMTLEDPDKLRLERENQDLRLQLARNSAALDEILAWKREMDPGSSSSVEPEPATKKGK